MTSIPEMDFMNKRRAVAPIIATLLMVAIAVVGGILIFVFAQGFFTDINVGAPTIELIDVFGYDARDRTDLAVHTGDELVLNPTQTTTTGGGLADTDAFTIHIRNRGNTAAVIEKVKVFGSVYRQTGDPTACSATVPAVGFFLMIDDDTIQSAADPILAVLGDCGKSFFTLGAGKEATLVLRYDKTLNNEAKVKIGRPIPIVITTGNGGTFVKQLQNGIVS